MKKILFLITLSILTSSYQYAQQQPEVPEDPFLWLEVLEGKKAMQWVKEKNSVSEDYITNSPEFESIYKNILEILNSDEQLTNPEIVGNYVYDLWKDDENKLGLWRRMPLEDYTSNKSDWENVLDFDSLSNSEDKQWVFWGANWLEPENKRCLIRISDGGKGAEEQREFDVECKTFVNNGFVIPESNSSFTWIDKNYVYVATPFGEGALTQIGIPRILKRWKRGTALSEAQTIFEADSTDIGVFSYVINTPEKKYEFIGRAITIPNFETYVNINNELTKLDIPKDFWLENIFKNQVIIALRSDWAVNGKTFSKGSLVSFDIDEFLVGKRNTTTIFLPDEKSSIIYVTTTKDLVLVNTMRNIQSKLLAFQFENNTWIQKEIETPEFGSIDNIITSNKSKDYFIIYSSFLVPTTMYHGNGFDITKVNSLPEYFDGSKFEVSQEEATSRDGTKIPYFMVYKKGVEFDGEQPTLLYAYGGFGASQNPSYKGTLGPWLERGGIYVMANIRGGGEFGPSWHQAAVKEKRQNAFDDFHAVAEDLINNKVTSPRHLGIFGYSNGGLLVGVAFTQHPELYNAVVCGSPLLDMKRYNKLFTAGVWVEEYGNPDIPEEWGFIKKYSPYHNLSSNKEYPEVLFTSSTNDDTVHSGHARKMAARMEELGHKVYYYETLEGGHLADITNEQSAYREALLYTFFLEKTK